MDKLCLSALMMSRLCHDLAASVTSLAYGKELLDDADAPELHASGEDLLKQGIATAITKLEFFRYAYGSAGLQQGDANMGEVARLVREYCALSGVQLHHDLAASVSSFARAQFLMNLVLIVSACLPRGGDIHIVITDNDTGSIGVRGSGGKLVVASHIVRTLDGKVPEEGWDARTIQPCFTILLADKLAMDLRLERRDDFIELEAVGRNRR